jgi:two-component system, chemotaxis family, chemotaxis protein CheV
MPVGLLHADDSGLIRRTTPQLLEEKQEFIVKSVVGGGEALEDLEKLKKQSMEQNKPLTDFIDIVLSDIEMPGMDGYHLCQRIKSDPQLKILPVILFSSLSGDC